jgi:hypothetical protein
MSATTNLGKDTRGLASTPGTGRSRVSSPRSPGSRRCPAR